MKKINSGLVIFLLFTGFGLSAQNNRMSLFYTFGNNELKRDAVLDGGPGYEGKNGYIFGLTYQYSINEHLALETGLEYASNTVKLIPIYFSDIFIAPYDVQIKTLTIPALVKYTFFKYAFINAGALFDFELDRAEYPVTDSQSGIGFSGGIGGEYTFRNFTVYINPAFRYHALIPFENASHQQHLTEAVLRFGIGYNF